MTKSDARPPQTSPTTELELPSRHGSLLVRTASIEEVQQFAATAFDQIFDFPSNCAFVAADQHPHRIQYLRRNTQCYVFRDGSETVGCFVGQASDWSTYYIRNAAIAREHRGKLSPDGSWPG